MRALLLATLAACSGGGGGGAPTFDFGADGLLLRVGEPVHAPATTATGADFAVDPALPAGLQLDGATGAITGTPSAVTAGRDHVVTGRLGGLQVGTTVRIAVGPALPAEVSFLEPGFAVERVTTLALPPAKMALAPDGRVFVTELGSGVVRLIDATGALVPTPFVTVPVLTGSHRGLLGVALSPTFATDSRVFALACTPAGGGHPDRSVLYRWNDVGGVAQNQVVLLDDLPVSTLNNGGALCFDATGRLLVSIGDTENPTLAQSDGSFAGKILRLEPDDGSAAADNPTPGSRVFAKGLRNTFALTLDPVTSGLLLADNGPASDDELDLLQPGRNFEWGALPGADFGALTGTQLRRWPDVVVPTGLAFRDAADALDWPSAHERSLYLTFYDDEIVQRFELSGSQRTDIDREVEFLRFVPNGTANKPLDIQRGPDGRLWILTFTAIYRVDRIR
ncbi:MAG: PQQ-dependent sugar dehydrogenase [Planctomycetes bacterium]|nr:PQQ-dependent sugar dehydrogenase [Planctomycetota bacterium]